MSRSDNGVSRWDRPTIDPNLHKLRPGIDWQGGRHGKACVDLCTEIVGLQYVGGSMASSTINISLGPGELERNKKKNIGVGGVCVVPVERYLILGCHRRIAAARIFRAGVRRGISTVVSGNTSKQRSRSASN